jgi:hypothetical protein
MLVTTTSTFIDTKSPPHTITAGARAAAMAEAPQVQLDTSMGSFTVELYNRHAPRTAKNFLELAKRGYYDGVKVCVAATQRVWCSRPRVYSRWLHPHLTIASCVVVRVHVFPQFHRIIRDPTGTGVRVCRLGVPQRERVCCADAAHPPHPTPSTRRPRRREHIRRQV